MAEEVARAVEYSPGEERRIGELVLAAAGLETAARQEYLRELTVTQPVLLEEARQRLALAAQLPEEFLAVPAAEILQDTDEILPADSAGDDGATQARSLVAGAERYELGECLGRGGMARVYRAFDSQLQRSVALKFLDHDSPEAIEGFLREARFQAAVTHEYVLDVYDTGELDGQPYIAMRLVEGTTLADLPATTSLEQKVQLLAQVAEGLHAAHRSGLIHRDVKPSNVLVETSEQGRLRPWVTDFGIALGVSDPSLGTAGMMAGTPAYLAPERLHFPEGKAGGGLDRRADVYSLGASLYQLLSGELPFAGASLLETLQRIRTEEPEPLRARAPNVPADLEAIVMRCLAKDPGARYPSARALAEDLGRFLDGEVVEAHSATITYRLARFAGRHRKLLFVVAFAAAALLAVLITFAVSTSVQSRRIAREAATAERVSDLLVGLFEVSDPLDVRVPSEIAGREITVREILDRGALDLKVKLQEDPEVRARLLDVIGNVYLTLALPESAEPLLREALELRRQSVGEADSAFASSLASLASLEYGRGRLEVAEQLARRAVKIFAADRQDVGARSTALRLLGSILKEDGRANEGQSFFQEALELLRQHTPTDALAIAEALREVSNVGQDLGDYEQAEEALLEAHRVLETHLGPDHPELGFDYNSLAVLHHRQGHLDQAEAYYQRSLELRERHLGADHPKLIVVLSSIGVLDSNRGHLEAAEQVLLRALAICEAHFSPNHHQTANVLNNLAEVYRQQGKLGDAEQLFRRSLAIREELGATADVGPMLNNLALLFQEQGDLAKAEAAFRRARSVFETHLGADHPNVGLILMNLAFLRREQDDFEMAEELIEKSLGVLEAGLGPDHFYVALALEGRADIHFFNGDPVSAVAILRRARKILKASLPPEHWRLAAVESGLGFALTELSDFAAAEPLLSESYAILLAERGADARRVRRARESLIELYEQTGRPELARQYR